MLGIVGTVPDNNFPMVTGEITLDGDYIVIENKPVLINRGTPALIAAAIETLRYMSQPNPYGFLVGDIGDGEGCKRLYNHLADQLTYTALQTITFHYYQPDVGWFKKVVKAIKNMKVRPVLIADAGFMYVAKMAGEAALFDLFTPDAGELAYLADEKAPHPFYTRGFILHEENLIPDLIKRAYKYNNAAKYLLVKGSTDYIAKQTGIIATVDDPSEEALEPIGGTGDTLTGIASALIASGMDIEKAVVYAARVNRLAGAYASPNPATQVNKIIKEIPQSLEEVLSN